MNMDVITFEVTKFRNAFVNKTQSLEYSRQYLRFLTSDGFYLINFLACEAI